MARAAKKKVEAPQVPAIDTFDEHEPAREINIRNAQGESRTYKVGEMQGVGVSWWVTHVSERWNEEEDKTSFDSEGLMETLISKCLTLDGHPVAIEFIEGWGERLKQKLFSMCKEVNGIDEDFARQAGK